ncbi:uncharacterized protein LOC126896486 [Daktulosphaira vitifoliae]|uniref:uncharacterized protein LOC126896486 n=1 Tax=Daktulosphaira vitifoliae TaxID=58002 RepID=UPI0021A97B99|nr:uncharacterized protein LOC126896486 [Daktulosphaira vitifoliae]
MQSQRWIFTSPGGAYEYKKTSITKEHYIVPLQKNEPTDEVERKRRDLEKFMWRTMTDRVLNELKEQQLNTRDFHSTCQTSYSESYNKNGFKFKELGTEIDEELKRKYPLYGDIAITVHLKEINKIKAKESIHKPLTGVFKRDNRFTSRLSNPQDTHKSVTPEHYAYV